MLPRLPSIIVLVGERKHFAPALSGLLYWLSSFFAFASVMSRIINDYLFRCPSWHYAHLLSLQRVQRYKDQQQEHKIYDEFVATGGQMGDQTSNRYYDKDASGFKNNVYVYRFSQPTHVPGFLECWGKSCHTSEIPYVFESMDIIRSDYSTLSPIAQKEAPVPPEYPYSDLLAAYQGTMENPVPKDSESKDEKQEAPASLTSRLSNYTSYFQRVLEHFFEDYFKEDADEEIAHDMAQRWVAFAKTGSPNYENSKAEWIPWRFVPDDVEDMDYNRIGTESSFEDYLSWDREEGQLYNVWRDIEDQALRAMDEDNGHVYNEEEQETIIGEAYRNRALEALNMEVVEQDSLRTELIRNKRPKSAEQETSSDYTFSTFGRSAAQRGNGTTMSPLSVEPAIEVHEGSITFASQQMIQQIQRMAQNMGVLGRGLSGEYDRLLGGGGIGGSVGSGSSRTGSSLQSGHGYWDDDFFPQFLELRWPPEGRLVESDCTCDFWGRIRCKCKLRSEGTNILPRRYVNVFLFGFLQIDINAGSTVATVIDT
jgi:hypothetical protein